MVDDPEELAGLFTGTLLEGRPVQVNHRPDANLRFLAVEVDEAELVPVWRAARSLVSKTGRWPMMGNPYPQGRRDDVLSALAETRGSDLAGAAARRREAGRAQLRAMRRARADAWGETADDQRLDYELRKTRRIYGSAPALSEVRRSVDPGDSNETLDCWLMRWEERQPRQPPARTDAYLKWFWDGGPLVFIPARAGAEVFGYLDFWGEQAVPGQIPAGLATIVDYWEAEYDAQLVANWGTMLQFVVDRPPRTLERALALAVEHELVAADTFSLPGVSLREHTRALIDRPAWFLHSRP